MTSAAKYLARGGRELITFRIGDRELRVNAMPIREICGGTDGRAAGLPMDAVSDILTVSGENRQLMPDMTSGIERNFAKGILSVDGPMIGPMELDAVFPNIESVAA